jgi:hypothetical protein
MYWLVSIGPLPVRNPVFLALPEKRRAWKDPDEVADDVTLEGVSKRKRHGDCGREQDQTDNPERHSVS